LRDIPEFFLVCVIVAAVAISNGLSHFAKKS